MEINKQIRLRFLFNALLVTLFLGAPIPFFSQIVKEIPIISLILGEVSLIFLVILASFPKAGIKDIIKIGCYYMFFIGVCFALLSFIPVEPKYKLFAFDAFEGFMPNLVSINLIGLIILNTVACLFFGMELSRKVPVSELKSREMESVDLETEAKKAKASEAIKQEVKSLFDLYLKDYKLGKLEENDKLENLERALLENMDSDISGALCADKDAKLLEDTVFAWSGYSKDALLEVFNAQSQNSKDLGTGRLCQMLFQDSNNWYIVAKYRGNYLMLQTEKSDPAPLLETSYRVFKAL
jgi:hypothetical protein